MIGYKLPFSKVEKQEKGFTILELIIAMVIMGILTSLTVVNVIKSQVTARDQERVDDVSTIARYFEGLYKQGLNTSNGSLSSYNEPLSYPSTLLVSSTSSSIASAIFNDMNPSALKSPNGFPDQAGTGCGGTSATYTDQQVTGSTSGGGVWGSCPYTNDSNLPKATVHAGILTPGQTATIRVYAQPGQSSYTGSTQHGVTTSSYGAWGGSISLELPGTNDSSVPYDLANATNTTKATTSNITPTPSADNDIYVYQPLNRDDSLCTSTTDTFYIRPDPTHCVKFQIFYYDETSQSIKVTTSINQ